MQGQWLWEDGNEKVKEVQIQEIVGVSGESFPRVKTA